MRTLADREAFWTRMFDFLYPRSGPPIPERPPLEFRPTRKREARGAHEDSVQPLPQIQTPSHSQQNQSVEKHALLMLQRRTTEATLGMSRHVSRAASQQELSYLYIDIQSANLFILLICLLVHVSLTDDIESGSEDEETGPSRNRTAVPQDAAVKVRHLLRVKCS